VVQDQLFDVRGHAIRSARDAIRRAREQSGTALPKVHPSSMSDRPRTIPVMTGGRMAEAAAPHGTRARYNSRTRPCRCGLCQSANARYMIRYREAKRHPGPPLPLAGRDVAVVDVDVKGRML
jgi:hypothetical protein